MVIPEVDIKKDNDDLDSIGQSDKVESKNCTASKTVDAKGECRSNITFDTNMNINKSMPVSEVKVLWRSINVMFSYFLFYFLDHE